MLLLPQTLAGAEEKLTVFQFSIQLFTQGSTLRAKLFYAGAFSMCSGEMSVVQINNNIHKIQMKNKKIND